MKHKAKKALSLVLALTLVLSLLPEMALPAAAAGSAGILTYAGSGTSDGVVYFLTRKTSSSDFKSGQNYIFVPGQKPADYLTELPAGSGVLRATSSGRAYRHSSITTYVDVVRRTAGFDGCPCGTLNYGDGRFGPQDPITRAEAATIVNHMLGRSPDRAYIMAHKSKLKQYPDLQDRVTEFPQTATKDSEVSVSAPSTWGTLKFSRWQYSTNGTTWKDLAAYLNVSFFIPCNMKVRALYVNPTTKPEVNMSATTYPVKDSASGYTFDSILFQMNYKLPDGYTYVDSGVRAGDNEGISYYELKERKRTAGEKAAWGALNFGANLLSGSLGDAFFAGAYSAATLDSNFYYEKRENSVLSEMSAATLGNYMYQNKPVNVEKYPPIYWDYKPNTVSYSGSINALIPVRFAQKNNQNHYIYGIAWLRYKDSSGNIKTIYTDALATTLKGVGSSGTVTKSGS